MRDAEPVFATPLEGGRPRAERFSRVSALFVDIDHFKNVNDTHGHPEADKVLAYIAGTLRRGLRPTDLVGRWGGEEMVAILPGASEAQAALRAEELRKTIEGHIFVDENTGDRFKVTASFGVATLENDGEATLDALVKRADVALYAAKESGRNCVVMDSVLTATERLAATPEPEQIEMDLNEEGLAEPGADTKNAPYTEPEQLGFDYSEGKKRP